MAERVAEKSPTLLTYLDPLRPGLRLSLRARGGPSGQSADPLEIHSISGAFSGFLQGAVGADGEHALADLFLLVQPDRYAVRPAELAPATNPQVESAWQAAFAALRAARGVFPHAFPEQIDGRERLLPWRPLLHCAAQGRFGHVLCPRCGGGLELCRDDRLLKEAGLPAYSESLERYLLCPGCRQTTPDPPFYALWAPHGGPPRLRDSGYLIHSMGRLLDRTDLAAELPCIGCAAAGECFGSGSVVRQRLRPLFFYPFFMLMHPAPSMHVLDFLELLSGSAFEAAVQKSVLSKNGLRSQRLLQQEDWLSSAEGFLFPQGGRRFGEVLYLKLTLLDELLALTLHSPDLLDEPARSMSLESLWIHLPALAPRLPLYWNFALRPIDAVGWAGQGFEDASRESRLRRFLGQAWCYVLLVNGRQSMARVAQAVERFVSRPGGIMRSALDDGPALDPVFASANLCEGPGPAEPAWEKAWRSALDLGFELVQSARVETPRWSGDLLRTRLNVLRAEIRQLLFSPGEVPAAIEASAPSPGAAAASEPADRHIARILNALLEQWPAGFSEASQPSPILPSSVLKDAVPTRDAGRTVVPDGKTGLRTLPDADGDYQETIILSSHPITAPETPAAPPPSRESLEETVWVGGAERQASKPPLQEFEATVLIAARGSGQAPPVPEEGDQTVILNPPAVEQPPADVLEQTVIISPGALPEKAAPAPADKKRGAAFGNAPPPPAGPAKPSWNDDLDQTIIIRPTAPKNRKPPS